MKTKYALISVYNKTNIEKICLLFKKHNIKIISTGSTANYIKQIGYKCDTVTKYTKFNEILDGRIKTLHPLIHASLLFDRKKKDHVKIFKNLKFPCIDFVVVNLYPFEDIIKKDSNKKNCIEMIDIGGPALLRSSAKNYPSITVISDVNDYKAFIKNFKTNNGKTSLGFRKKMAGKVFSSMSSYDQVIAKWMTSNQGKIIVNESDKKFLRYGENPHQQAFYINKPKKNNIVDHCIKNGKGISYNNIIDIESAYNCVSEFKEPTCAIVKHSNPCGVASHEKINGAYKKAYRSDPISAFGSIVALNRNVNQKLAESFQQKFIEVIVAKSFDKKAKYILNKSKNLILIETKKIKIKDSYDIRSIYGGYLLQEKNNILFSKKNMKCVTKCKATKKQINDLIFCFKVCKHVKSNAIVLVKNKQTIGIGAGQMSRIDSVKLAVSKIVAYSRKNSFVAASDAFFPFTDNIKFLIKNNCCAIIQPSGSINDNKIIAFSNKRNIPLYFSNYRFFKH